MYGQKNYNDFQGIPNPNKKSYRISQIGCFLVSFANLLTRFNEGVDPLTLNKEFADRGIWIDTDDGVRDDLGFFSISQYRPNIRMTNHVVAPKGQHAIPKSNNAIVKFNYVSGGGAFANHFSLVHDALQGLIVDSWDGQIKSWDTYGGPVECAEYADDTPAVVSVQPVPTSPALSNGEITVLMGWGLAQVAKEAGFDDWESPDRWSAIASLNGSANWQNFNASLYPGQRIRVSSPEPTPTITPTNTEQELVTVQKGWGLRDIAEYAGFADFEMPARWAEIASLNGSGVWQDFNSSLSVGQIVRVRGTASTPAPAVAPPIVATEPVVAKVAEPIQPLAYRDTFVADPKNYIAIAEIIVTDVDGINPPIKLPLKQLVKGAGRFTKDGQQYVISNKHYKDGRWYGIPASALEDEQGNRYSGPLNIDDNDLMGIDLSMEAREAFKNFSPREKLVALFGRTMYLFTKLFKRKNKKELL